MKIKKLEKGAYLLAIGNKSIITTSGHLFHISNDDVFLVNLHTHDLNFNIILEIINIRTCQICTFNLKYNIFNELFRLYSTSDVRKMKIKEIFS